MNARRITDATMRVRDYLYEGLLLRVSEDVARERANNLATGVIELLHQMAEEAKPPPVRNIPSSICTHQVTEADGKCSACGNVTNWRDAPEVKAIR